ncbi:MAG: hypothetical protein ABR508_02090 [Candidatus Baltobacteraceae bacterium]
MRRKLNWKFLGFGVGAALLLYVIIGIVLAGREPAPPPPGSEPIVLMGCKGIGNRISTRSWSFQCKRATMSADGVNATIEGVHDGVLYKKGKPYLKLSAKEVAINTQSFDFNAIGTVHIETISSNDGTTRTFETDLVQWTNATKLLLLSHPSIIRTGDQVLKVTNMSIDFSKDEVHLGKIEGGLQAPGIP